MKKRFLSALLATVISVMSAGAVNVAAEASDLILSSTTKVNVENTDTCFAKATDSEYHVDSNYYMHFKSERDWLEVTQNLTETAVANGQYVLTVVAKPISGRLWFRVGWDSTAWMVVEQSDSVEDLGDGWYKYVKEITMTADQANILFHNDSELGTAEFYIDSMSLKPIDEDKELVPNSGFDFVTYDSAAGITTANNTTVNVANTDNLFAKVLGETLDAENEYSLHFAATGNDWLEVTQELTETAKAGSQYVLTAYVKPVTGKVWFYVDWDATGWMATHAADVIAPQPDGWTMVQKTITMSEDKTKLLFHNDGATEMYIDDISLVEVGGTENLIPDGGFGEVTVEEPIEDIPDEKLILSGTTHLNMENTDTCFAKVTDDTKSEGSYSLHFKATESDWFEVEQTLTKEVKAGETYLLSASVKVVSGKVWFRVGWDDAGWLLSNQTSLGTDVGNGWIKLVKEVTLTEDQTRLLFHNDGEAEMYIDDISLVAVGGTENLVPDGGFEEVTIEGGGGGGAPSVTPTPTPTPGPEDPDEPSVDIPDENLILSGTTHLNMENTDTCFAKVTDDTKSEGNYSLHFKTTAADGFEIDQTLTEPAVAGSKYIISASVKGVTGRVWFRLGWDNDAWMAVDQNATGADLGDGWIRVTKEVTVAGNEGDIIKLLFHNDGETEAYIDDISVKAVDGDVELVPDGGFEEVTVNEPVVDIPDEKLVLSDKTTVNVENTDTIFAKVTDDDKGEGSYAMHFKSGTDHLEVSQRLAESVVAGGTYIISADVKVISGQLWFRLGWDDNGWMAVSAPLARSVLPAGWEHIEKEVTLLADQTTILFHNNGETEAYIDNLSVKAKDSDTELVPDGGFEDVIVACDEHAYDEGVETQAPTCTQDGVKTFICTVCGLTKTEAIPATDHSWDEGVVTLEPTVDAEGIRTYTCSCGEKKTEAIEKLPAPSYTPGDANEDTEVDVKDVITIRRFVTGGYGVTINEAAANVNGDTEVDVKDVITLRRFITGGYGVELQ